MECLMSRCLSHASGVETIHGLGSLSDYEKEIYSSMKPELLASIEKGIKFVKEN